MSILIQLSKLFKLTTKNTNNTSVALMPKRGGGVGVGGGSFSCSQTEFSALSTELRMSYFNFKTSLVGAACKHSEHSKVLVLNKKCFPYKPPGGVGVLDIFLGGEVRRGP